MTDSPAELGQAANRMVGQRIRLLREQRKLSLRALAERSGLSSNAISKIERGENSPTVGSLHVLAAALNVPITEFFQESGTQRTVYVQHADRKNISVDQPLLESLGSGLQNQQLEPFLLTIPPHTGEDSRLISHTGQEFVYCLQGEPSYEVAGERYTLTSGDCLLFEADQPHRCLNLTPNPAVLLLVFYSRGNAQSVNRSHLEP